MKKLYFGSSGILSHDFSYRSQWSESKKQLLDDTKTQILKSIESGTSAEVSIMSDLLTIQSLSERYSMFSSLSHDGAFDLAIRELLCEGKVVKLNGGNFYVPTTECEKTLAKQLAIALAHYNPKDV